MNGARQMLVYGDDIKMVGGSGGQYIVKKGTDTLLVASKETGLEVKAEKTEVYGHVSRPERRIK